MVERFECKMCSFVQDYKDAPAKCPKCWSGHYRIRYMNNSPVKTKFVNLGYKDTPRYSVSMGVSEAQIKEAIKLHPQAEWKKFGHSYRPLIKNRTDKLRMMKQCGMEEFGVEQFKGKQ
jgi:hypothetical protein